MKIRYSILSTYLLICCTPYVLVQGIGPHGSDDVKKLYAEIEDLEGEKQELQKELEQCKKQKEECKEELHHCHQINEQLQASVFGTSDASTVSHDPTYADSDDSDEADSPSVHIEKLEHYSQTLEDRLKDCNQAEQHLRILEQQLEQKQEALRNCQQLSGAAKVGAGAAGLSQLTSTKFNTLKRTQTVDKNQESIVLNYFKEGGFILFKQAAKESIPKKAIVEWKGHSLLDTHELTEITAEGLKAYTHGKDLTKLARFSAQLYARVKIMEQLDKYGITQPIDKLEYHTRILVRGLLCKGVDYLIMKLTGSDDKEI